MKTRSPITIFLLLVILTLVSGCSKNNDTHVPPPVVPEPPPPVNTEPLRVVKRIFRHMDGNELIVDTFAFEYDQSGRVTSKFYPGNEFHEAYGYTGDKLTSIRNVSDAGTAESLNFANYSDNGDTILLDFSRPDGTAQGMDTVQLTYIYKDDLVTDYWLYLHSYNGFTHSEKNKFVYNEVGNLLEKTYENLLTAPYTKVIVTEWDDKVNPKHGQPKLNHIFLDLGLAVESYSLHNPIKYSSNQVVYEPRMTYNAEGYPLTVKFDNQDFIGTELIYNR